MEVRVIEDTRVLIPNSKHKNFTDSSEVIKKGARLEGKEIRINGKRRGSDFVYTLFSFQGQDENNKPVNKLIYIKQIEPMEATEVSLGADSQVSETVVKIPSGKKLFTKNVVIATLGAAGAGFAFAKHKKVDRKKTIVYTLGAAVLGFGISKYYEHRKAIKVVQSK